MLSDKGRIYPPLDEKEKIMKNKKVNVSLIDKKEKKDIKNETAELNGVKVDPDNFEIPRTTIEMLEQTFQIA